MNNILSRRSIVFFCLCASSAYSGVLLQQFFDDSHASFEVVQSPSSKVVAETTNQVGRTEPGARQLIFPAGKVDRSSLSQYFSVSPGSVYTCVVYAKVDGMADMDQLIVSLQTRDQQYQMLQNPPTPLIVGKISQPVVRFREWKRLTLTLEIPTGDPAWAAVKKLLFLYGASGVGTPGKVYFDDLEIHEYAGGEK